MVKELVDFKWKAYAQWQHRIGARFHMLYVFSLWAYIIDIFLRPPTYDKDNNRLNPEPNKITLSVILACLSYPIYHDAIQLYKTGFSYLADKWNYLDLLHIGLGLYNVYLQWYSGTWDLLPKIVFITVTLICLLKTFFFMRIIMSFSYIVTMIINVVADLKVFMLFFAILIVMFSAIFDVIAMTDADEYKNIGPFMGNVMTTLRLSLGDFYFGVLMDKNQPLPTLNHWLYWIIWVFMVIFSSLIFLNFIIAEVSNSYANAKENIDSLIYKERASLIQEIEDITPEFAIRSNTKKFPKYIVVRQLED